MKGVFRTGNEQRLPHGYAVPIELKEFVSRLCQTSLVISVLAMLSDWALIGACMFIGTLTLKLGWFAAATLHLFLFWPLCDRGLRGLENLVHETAHFNHSRRRRRLNDWIGNLLCAYPLLQSVGGFRTAHQDHHLLFGSERDPDCVRYRLLGIDRIEHTNALKFLMYVFLSMPAYLRGFYGQFAGNRRQVFVTCSFHGVLVFFGSLLLTPHFWLLWVVYVVVPFVFYLPVHRSVAEASKHRYENATSEFAATFSHLGFFQRWFLHPHGDAFHLLHHLIPGIPHWKMPHAHRSLLKLDPNYARGGYRLGAFSDPL
jgi:fatty acid desaturase